MIEHGFPDRAELERRQLEKLRALLAAILPANRFYAAKLAGTGVGPEAAELAAFTRAAPFTTKAELARDQERHPPYGTDLSYPLERYSRCHQTSGSTREPLRWLDTPEDWQGLLENWKRVYAAAGVDRADRIFFAFSFGPFLGFWTAFEAARQLGALCLPGGGLSSLARLKTILDLQATALCCTPTYARRLAEVAAAEGVNLNASRVRAILVAGEPGGSLPSVRLGIEKAWPRARVYDHHGMTEVGPVTYACPARSDVLHVIEDAYLPEVVNPADGAPLPPGAAGELVLTTLARPGSPLLRYRTGDLVRSAAAPQCACGSYELALEGGILGRTDDMLLIRGVNVYPGAVEEVVRSCGEVVEFRVEVGAKAGMTELKVQIEAAPAADAKELAARLEARFREAFNLRIPVEPVAAGALPRFEMKARRWVRADAGEEPAP
ncbi:MAG: AMP-binding protein [Planctomycetota bacterium]|nr:AMP-binding protein [Planctomycetota bacterium]